MPSMKLCRFEIAPGSDARIGLIVNDGSVLDLTSTGIQRMANLLEHGDVAGEVARLSHAAGTRYALGDVRLLTPVESQEVWAAGVTYLRSKEARMVESEFSASAYDLVYDAVRPEIFFKSLPEKVVAPGG